MHSLVPPPPPLHPATLPPFSESRTLSAVLFLSQAIQDSVSDTSPILSHAVQFCPVVTARYEKGLPRAIDDRETDEVNTHDRAGMLIG